MKRYAIEIVYDGWDSMWHYISAESDIEAIRQAERIAASDCGVRFFNLFCKPTKNKYKAVLH